MSARLGRVMAGKRAPMSADPPVAVPAEVVVIDTSSLGDRSYLVYDGAAALVVDPQRDLNRVLDLARIKGVQITHVLESHVHNDYVSGGLELARATRADNVLSAVENVAFEHLGVADGEAGMLCPAGRRAVNVEGGMSAWMRAGLPVVTRHAGPDGLCTAVQEELSRLNRSGR